MIQVHGPSQNQFSLIWNRVRNTNHGSIVYQVRIQIAGDTPLILTTPDNHIILTDHFAGRSPYTRFLVGILAATAWAKSG